MFTSPCVVLRSPVYKTLCVLITLQINKRVNVRIEGSACETAWWGTYASWLCMTQLFFLHSVLPFIHGCIRGEKYIWGRRHGNVWQQGEEV